MQSHVGRNSVQGSVSEKRYEDILSQLTEEYGIPYGVRHARLRRIKDETVVEFGSDVLHQSAVLYAHILTGFVSYDL